MGLGYGCGWGVVGGKGRLFFWFGWVGGGGVVWVLKGCFGGGGGIEGFGDK